MGIHIDFTEFDIFKKKFNKFSQNFNDFLKDFLSEMANKVVAKTKQRTNVISGQLRSGWDIGQIQGNGTNIFVEIYNPTEYATEVEYGHRGVYVPELGVTMWTDRRFTKGQYMLTISIEEVRKQMPKRYEEEFNQFVRKLGIV